MKSKKNLVLLGMMGSGKSIIGFLISKKLKLKFFDIDNVIEKEAHMNIAEIFSKKGENFFRNLEEKITIKSLESSNVVISLGGGGFVNEKIRKDAGRERQIGHSYFMKNDEAISEIVLLRDRFKSKIIPLIQDYFYEDMNKVHKILGEDFIDKTEETVKEKTLNDLDAFADAVNAI